MPTKWISMARGRRSYTRCTLTWGRKPSHLASSRKRAANVAHVTAVSLLIKYSRMCQSVFPSGLKPWSEERRESNNPSCHPPNPYPHLLHEPFPPSLPPSPIKRAADVISLDVLILISMIKHSLQLPILFITHQKLTYLPMHEGLKY